MSDDMNEQPPFPEAELARLADGTLPESRQAELRAQVEQTPELARAFAEQERAVAMIRALDVSAPESLRATLEALAAPAPAPPPTGRRGARSVRLPRLGAFSRRGWAAAGGLATAAAVAVVLAITLGGGSTGPSLAQAAQVAIAPATAPSPAEDVSNRTQLRMSVAGIPFPYWGKTIGWRTAGARIDTLGGRRVGTVFYRGRGGVRVGYAIVPGAALPVSGGHTVWRNGIPFTILTEGGARTITWLRSGHTCVIAGRHVTDGILLALASAEAAEPVADARWTVPS